MQALDKYLSILADEAQRDMEVFHNPWLAFTVLPITLYTAYAFLKWYVLLMPVTLPLTLWAAGKTHKSATINRNN
jgi:hypothetical protein